MAADGYDYIVIGAGSAGCVVAHRLGEDPKTRVLVLDAGGPDDSFLYRRPGALGLVYQVPQLKKKADWGYHTVPQRHMDERVMPVTRSKILGGCSSVNGMLYIRGNRANYDGWRDMGCEGWGYDDVLPLFRRSESHEDGESTYHGGDGPLKVTHQWGCSVVSEAFRDAAAAACGVPVLEDFNGAEQEGAGLYQMTCADRRRMSTAVTFLHPAVARGNVELVRGAHAARIELDGRRAVAVHYLVDGEPRVARAAREIVLSAGVIGSAQVLMLSGIGPADHLRSVGVDVAVDLPGVGGNLHDHLLVPVRFHATRDTGHTSTAGHFLSGMLQDLLFRSGWFGKTFLEGGAFVKTRPEASLPDLQFHSIPWAYPEPNDDVPEQGVIAKTHSFTVLPGILYPKSRGTIRLESADPTAHPRIDPNYLADDADMAAMVRGIELTREIAATEPLRDYLRGEAFPGPECRTEADIRAHIRVAAKTIFHPVGTCKMGIHGDSVVDPELRVRGVDGLRVADASIMPTIVGGNTNAPTIMIGEKCSDLLLQQ